MASQNGHLDVVQTLLEAGADVNIHVARSTVSHVMFYCYMYMYEMEHSLLFLHLSISMTGTKESPYSHNAPPLMSPCVHIPK